MNNGLYYLNIRILKPSTSLLTRKRVQGNYPILNLTNEHNNDTVTIPTANTPIIEPNKPINEALELFHQRMGHINLKACEKLAKDYNIKLIKNSFNILECSECNEAKMV